MERCHIIDPSMDRRRPRAAVRALCCVCGQVRTCSNRYAFTRDDANRAFDDFHHPEGWRMTGTLKCSNCSRPTRHALLREGPLRDSAEQRQDRWASQRKRLEWLLSQLAGRPDLIPDSLVIDVLELLGRLREREE